MTVSTCTERELISRIQQQLPPVPSWLPVGIGDDAAVVEPERNRLEVFTVDAVIDGVHFDRRFTPPDAIGHRALAVNLSDLAAMGAKPRLVLLSFALPADLPLADFDGIVSGIAQLAAREGITVAGGNLTRTPGPLTIDITAVGTVKRRNVLTRSGARPGDLVYVSGSIGAAAAGLAWLQRDGTSGAHACIERYLRPTARIKTGLLLARNRAATACVDLSDGFADGVRRIAEASAVGVTIDASTLPIEADARDWFGSVGQDAVQAAICGGDDYELLFTVRPRQRGRLKAAMQHGGIPLTRVGICTGDRALLLQAAPDDAAPAPLPDGFTHFR
ncbi:MAG: thiamine-phosphate kinase [Vicinamibacterales bacterium]